MRRDYAGAADVRELALFAQRIWSVNSRWHLGDLAWGLGQVPDGKPDWRMALWRTGGDVVAWGWVTLPDNLALMVDPGYPT